MPLRRSFAHLLDWANVKAVEWRLEGRSAMHLEARACPTCEPPHLPHPVGIRDGIELWGVNGGDWRAERHEARNGSSDAALVMLHGWLAGPMQFAFYRWLTGPVREYAEVWMPRLPEHGERSSPGALSGELCLSADLELTANQLRRAREEVRWLVRWLRTRHRRVAVWGVSLGGWVAALARPRELDADLVLWEPVLDPVRALGDSGLGSVIGRRLSTDTRDTVRQRLGGELSPLASGSQGFDARVMIVGGSYDDIAPPDVLAAAARQSGATLLELPHGHISLLTSRRARAATLGFLRERLLEAILDDTVQNG